MTCLHPSPLHAVRLAPQPSHQTSRWLSSLHIWLHFQSFVLLQLHLVLKKIFYIQQMQNKLLKDFFISGIIPLYAASLIRFAVSVSISSTIPSTVVGTYVFVSCCNASFLWFSYLQYACLTSTVFHLSLLW